MTADEKRLIAEHEQRLAAEELAKRRAAGAARKLYQLEIFYTSEDGEIKKHYQSNLYLTEMKTMRENIFSIGLMTDYAPGMWLVIPPMRIGQVFVLLQKNYYEK